MSDRVEIKSVVIALPGGATHDLTLDEARQLSNQLNELFGRTITYVQPTIPTVYPVYIDRPSWPNWLSPVWCSSSTVPPVDVPTVYLSSTESHT